MSLQEAKKDLNYLARHLTRRNFLAKQRAQGLCERERLPWPALQARQEALLRRSLAAAQRHLPRYAALAVPTQGSAEDLFAWFRAHCPVLTKADLVAGRAEFYPNQGQRRPWWPAGKTSGTSGAPLEVFRSLDAVVWEEAFNLQLWAWAGFKPGDPQAVLRGDQVADPQQTTPPFWRWDRFGRQLFMSSRHVAAPNVRLLLDALRASGAQMLRTYPSSSFELARLAQQQGLKLPLRSVVTGSEPLYPLQREMLEQVFSCKVFDFYGMAERVAYAAQCEHGHYHLNPEYSWVEILDEHNQPTDGFGFVVGTTFHNEVMPLLRYRISDQARWVKGACPCGRTYPRIELSSGKVEDQLFDREGAAVSASVITFAFKGLANIRKSQVAQLGLGEWEVRVVPEPAFTGADSQALLANIEQHVSHKVTVTVRLVDDIARLPSGKFKWVSQEWAGARRT
jgi:phenylacetate-CoA ligase